MSETDGAVEAINRNIRVAGTLIRQAVRSLESGSPARAARPQPAEIVDGQLVADLRLAVEALWGALGRDGRGDEIAEAFTEWQDDKRRESRVALALKVSWDGLPEGAEASTSDISGDGCFIHAQAAVAVGERRFFEVKMPTGRSMRLHGEVKYHKQAGGFGVHFIDLNDLERSILALLIDHARGEGVRQALSFS